MTHCIYDYNNCVEPDMVLYNEVKDDVNIPDSGCYLIPAIINNMFMHSSGCITLDAKSIFYISNAYKDILNFKKLTSFE